MQSFNIIKTMTSKIKKVFRIIFVIIVAVYWTLLVLPIFWIIRKADKKTAIFIIDFMHNELDIDSDKNNETDL